MKNCINFFIALLIFTLSNFSNAQKVYHEIGFGVGPISFRGDWGEREDAKTNYGNTGVGVNLLHFVNFAYGRNFNSYFNQHFKLRNQLSISYTKLNHYGRWVNNEDPPFLLANMQGETFITEIGTGLEWNWFALRNYERYIEKIQPFAGVGINMVYYNPSVETKLPGIIGSPSNTWPTFLPENNNDENPITNSPAVTAAINLQAGSRYRLNKDFDLFIEGRWHYYFSDFVDGLNPRNPNNESNDWIFFLNFGAVYYLD